MTDHPDDPTAHAAHMAVRALLSRMIADCDDVLERAAVLSGSMAAYVELFVDLGGGASAGEVRAVIHTAADIYIDQFVEDERGPLQ